MKQNLANVLQAMDQDEKLYQQYIPLALHLADEYFLTHQSRDVQLLVACCIADVLRVYAPEAPYKDQDQIKVNQLNIHISLIIYFILYLILIPIVVFFLFHRAFLCFSLNN